MSENKPDMYDIDVIIPFRAWDDWTAECVSSILSMIPKAKWITLVPDEPLPPRVWDIINELNPAQQSIREVPSGAVNPGQKRNAAMRKSSAAFFGFIDADARPASNWLAKGMPLFDDDTIVIAGGPNLTPPEDSCWQKAYGHVMASPLGMGAGYIRHIPVSPREVGELPSCNMLVRKIPDLFFNPDMDTAEDMAFCGLAASKGGRIMYDPTVTVFHHRRKNPGGFFRQFMFYGLYQGQRACWRNVWRAAPFALLFCLVLMIAGLCLWPAYWMLWLLSPALYAMGILLESIRLSKPVLTFWRTATGFLIAHGAYGLGYAMGLFNRLARRKNPVH